MWIRKIAALESDLRDLRLIPAPRSRSSSEGSDGNDRERTERVHVRRSHRD